jgi:hypothetical protein
MIPKIMQKGGEGGIAPFWVHFQPKRERSNTRRNEAPNFYFRAEIHYGRVILSGLTN